MTLPLLAAAGAIVLWSTLAALGLTLAHLPPFLLTGCALVIGAIPGIAQWRQWRVPLPTLLLGIGGLFGFHFLLFLALRLAPPVEANLVNYLWPLLIVVLTPVLLPGWRLTWRHGAGGAAGPCRRGAGDRRRASALDRALDPRFRARRGIRDRVGVLLAAVPARAAVLIVGDRRLCVGVRVARARVSRAVRAARRRCVPATSSKLLALGLGPMGAAFYLWDIAMKRGDPRVTGVLAYATPLLSTTLLLC